MTPYAFFLKHAGYSYPTGADARTRLIYKRQNARALAFAEAKANVKLAYILEDEAEQWDGDYEPPRDCYWVAVYKTEHVDEREGRALRGHEGDWLASVGMVGVNDGPRDPYIRVVVAQLYLEALESLDREYQAEADELASRATYAAGCAR